MSGLWLSDAKHPITLVEPSSFIQRFNNTDAALQ